MLLIACTNNTGKTTPGNTPGPNPTQQFQGSYNLPDWWRPCVTYDKVGHCTSWDMTKNPVQCDGYNYKQKTGITPVLLTTWKGLQVCGPLPLSVSTPDNYVDFYVGGSIEQEFECTELVKRYLYLAYGLKSQPAYGKDVVSVYTTLPNTPFHEIPNDGSIQMAPQAGDVLSYGASPQNASGHTSIVTGSRQNADGTWSISVIEENLESSGTATLIMGTDWKIQPDDNHFGQVSSWMTIRPISSQPSTPTPTATPTSTPSPTPTPTATPRPTPTATPSPIPTETTTVYHISVDVSQENPTDTGIQLKPNSRVTIQASGWVAYGTDSGSGCDGNPLVNPDGQRTLNGVPCDPKMDSFATLPSSPIGTLIGEVGLTNSWFAVGSQFTSSLSAGELYLLFNDDPGNFFDNSGTYTVTITVTQ